MIAENIVLSQNFTWTDIENPLPGDLRFIENEFDVPAILLADSLRPGHLPKYELLRNHQFFLLRMYDVNSPASEINSQKATSKLAIFIYEGRVITLHPKRIPSLRKFADNRGSSEFPIGARDLVYKIFRICVQTYEEALSELQLEYEGFEKAVLSADPVNISSTMVYDFRRKLYIVKGLVQLIQQALQNSRSFWGDQTSIQQDIKENLDLLFFRLEGVRQNFDQLFALHLSINEQRSNDVMKVLTVFASVMLPLTFIASFYGMNFEHLPGLHTTKGFVGAIVIMATTTFVTIWYFARKKWFRFSV